MTREEFIHSLLADAQESGIAEAEVYYHESESMRALVNKGEIEEYTVNKAGGLSLRGLVDGKLGMAYTEAFDRDAKVMMIRGVLESATLVSDMDEQFIFPGSPAYEKVETLGNTGTAQERIDFGLALDRDGRVADPRVKELGFTFVETEHEVIRICNTHGLDLRHEGDACVGYVEAIAREGERVATGEGVAAALSLGELDAGAIAREAVESAVSQLDAAPCESGEMPVIFRNTAMANMLGVFAGVFSADAAQKGMSLLAGKEGERIAADCVTLIDDPLLPGGLHSRAFDAEGVATMTKNVIDGGVLQTLLHNLKTARKAGCASTGNAARAGYVGAVGVAPSNFYIKPGEEDLAALEARMGDGLVITDVSGLHAGANPVSGDFSLLSQGYLVRGGKRAASVEQVTVAGNFYALLKGILAVGSDLRGQGGSVRCPSVYAGTLSVAGK